MLISTLNDIPGGKILHVLGIASGTCVRSRNIVGNVIGGLRAVFGGNQGGYTEMVKQSRLEATNDMINMASEKGANAIICVRYDNSEFNGGQGPSMNEVFVYGTAVKYERQAI
jgi:uncharacterized protein YbjQ (UPF0145 family)